MDTQSLVRLFQNITIPVRDFVYPPVCLICDRYLNKSEEYVCASCWKQFSAIDSSHPAWKEISEKLTLEGSIESLLSCFLFEKEGALQHAIHLLKYEGMRTLGVKLGREIGFRMLVNPEFQKADGLIPIPLHALKRRERGYNQSEYICKGISEVTGIPVVSTFITRKKYTESQTQLNIDERRANVGDAFHIDTKCDAQINGKRFILVDDVITTGSTITACANILLQHEASSVLAASVALAE